MSRPYNANSARTHFSQRNRADCSERSASSSSKEHFEGQRKGRGGSKHPPWLKGREIGLYYRDKQKRKHEANETRVIRLDEDLQWKIRTLLDQSNESPDDNIWNNVLKTEKVQNEFEKKYTHIGESQFKRKFIDIISGSIQENLDRAIEGQSGLQQNPELDHILVKRFKEKQSTCEYENMLKFRQKLPAYQKRKEILDFVNENQVVVISGETGCGKTTQVAQIILDHQIESGNGSITKIVCTQPRRISAISIAERVAAERAERLGDSVGFQIRLEKQLCRDHGSILFCTTGMLLQFMRSDPALKAFSHVILDEIHERTTESDFIITLLKQVIPKRPDLKIILMSATLNSERFSKYYNNCATVHIPGFTYPVEEFYLEDVLLFTKFQYPENISFRNNYRKPIKKYRKSIQRKDDDFLNFIEPHIRRLIAQKTYPKHVIDQLRNPNSENLSLELIEELVRYISFTKEPGAILIFLPGMMDIIKLNKLMLESGRYPQSSFVIYPVHSRMPTVDQKLIFKEPPEGVRKVIIATSIAETSITIEDVVYVIDCGKTKLSRFDVERNIQTLEPEWVTVANAKQRRGRAGRVRSGCCYHLYSKFREMTFDQYPTPEMLRTRLEEVILQIKILQLGKVTQFLSIVMDPPNPKAINLSLDLLTRLNALDSDEHLTPLGYHLAQLPLDPRTGKMIIWAALFSCVEPVFAIAASLTFKDAFYCPLGKEKEAANKKLELSMNQYSDHIALAEALRRFESAYRKGNAGYFCREYFASFNTLKLLSDMKNQFAQYLREMKFLDNDNPRNSDANRNSNNIALIKAIVCAGLYPNIATVRHIGKHGIRCWTPEDGAVQLHPSSVNEKARSFPSPFLVYFTKQRSTAIFIHDTSCVTAPILLFADPRNYIKREKGRCVITLDTSKKFICELGTAEIIEKLQQELTNLLEYKITHPGKVEWATREGRILQAIIELVSQEDEAMGFKDYMLERNELHSFEDT